MNEFRANGARPIPKGMFEDEPRKHFVTDGTVTLNNGKEKPMYFVFCRPCGYMFGYVNTETARLRLGVHKDECEDESNNMKTRYRQRAIYRLLEARDNIMDKLDDLGYDEQEVQHDTGNDRDMSSMR